MNIFKEGAVLAARVFQVFKSLQNKLVLLLKRISSFLHFSLLYVVYFVYYLNFQYFVLIFVDIYDRQFDFPPISQQNHHV